MSFLIHWLKFILNNFRINTCR